MDSSICKVFSFNGCIIFQKYQHESRSVCAILNPWKQTRRSAESIAARKASRGSCCIIPIRQIYHLVIFKENILDIIIIKLLTLL